jgi:3D (Asp-Asp-Asp) domain-containing protein
LSTKAKLKERGGLTKMWKLLIPNKGDKMESIKKNHLIYVTVFTIGIFMLNALLVTNSRAEVFKVTAYCSCVKCCNKKPSDKWYGITATGKEAKWGTVAVDRNVIRLGSKLRIEGFPNTTFRAEDVGGAIKGNHIDIWFPSHKEALKFGVKKMAVYCIDKTPVFARLGIQLAALKTGKSKLAL